MSTRIRIISTLIFLFACLLCAKLYSLQIIYAGDFAARADRQYQRSSTSFDRGTIYFSDKDGHLISAATLKKGFILSINPATLQKATSTEAVFEKLSAIITDLDKEDFYARAAKKSDSYEEIRKNLDEALGTQIAALKIPGVSLYEDKWRYYPGGTLASHVLGFMAYKGDELAGRYGLERSYDSVLTRNSNDAYSNFFAELFSNFKKVGTGGSLEGDIVTSIEPRTQAYVENTIKDVAATYSSEQVGAIIMNPQNGEVYAMALTPTFDPNNFKKVTNPALFRNDLVESVYEMGSIIKPLTFSAGFDLDKITATTTYNDKGSITSNNRTIWNFDKKARGVITLQEALSKSLNTGPAYVLSKIGNEALARYFKSFGVGDKTHIDLPNEAMGLTDNLKSPRDIEYITASFGQGVAFTPVEVIRAFSAIANNGMMVTPHVVRDVQYRVGVSKAPSFPPPVQVIKQSSAQGIMNMMVYNVDHALLDGKAMNPHYSVAAKTGTAQMALNGKYEEDRFLHSFIGFLPANNPKFLVFMFTVNPRGVSYASETLAKPFIELTKFLINYYQVPPDR